LKQPIPFGKYYLLERINVGGMAEVFKAKATGVEGFERMVAVKRILPSIAEDEEFITMFIDEAKIAVQLTHANIAQIFDLGKVDDSYFIALEYVHGKDLRAIFNRARSRGEQLPIPMACYAVMKLCEGLDYAHNKRDAAGQFLNLVHRDVSPQNILVSYEGEVKIIDFGIAKAAGKAGKTQAGILKGKFGYMSPEQVQGVEIDRRSDIFGVGICLYELLTGERLFVGESDFATLEKVRNVDIMPPSTYNRRIPEELEQIVLKALARDRDARHQTAMQLHDELQSFMYASGNFFGRRDLSMYMHRVFAEEIQKESSRDQEYAALAMPSLDQGTGLNAFEEIDPVSALSALNPAPVQPQAPTPSMAPGPGPTPSRRPAPPPPRKQTLLGVPPPRSMPPGKPSVPPVVPAAGSIPPGHARPAQGSAPNQAPGLDMDWDDDELSTQIYDRPDSHVGAVPQPTAPLSGSFPPALKATLPGQGAPPPGAVPSMPPQQPASQPGQAQAPTQPGAPSPFGGPPAPTAQFPTQEATPAPAMAVPGSSSRRPMTMAVLVVAAILGLIVVGLLFFSPPSPGTVHLSTTPRDVSVSLDGRAIAGSSPFVIGEVEPETLHSLVVSKTGYRSWESKFELKPGETMDFPPVSLEALESGFALDSVPSGAAVIVDGERLGTTTPVRVTDLAPGDHQIRLEAEGYSPWESSLHVTSGSVLDLPKATLNALKKPEKDKAGEEPRQRRAERHERRARPRREPRYEPPPAPEQASEVEPAPRPAPKPAAAGGGTGTLRVQTRPWSKVMVDGRLIGSTPQMNIPLSAGSHTLTLVNDEFGLRKTLRVNIEAGEVTTKILNLAE
jgi:serine/threonine protein kinase